MRILILAPTLPLPFGSADARWLHVIVRELARRGHAVRCISCTEEGPERIAEAERLAGEAGFGFRHVERRVPESLPVRKLRSFLRPFSEYARVPELRHVLSEELAAGPDVVHVEHLVPLWATRDSECVVYLHHLEVIDWERRRRISPRERLDRWQIGRATRRLLGRQERVIAASERLREGVLAINPSIRARVVPVALDPGLYPPLPPVSEPVLGVVGSMHWYPSRAAAERVLTRLWPEIRRRAPDARLLVAGWSSERYLARFFPADGAELVGEVAHPQDFFSRIGLLLYPPPRGSGMKIKVLESMAYGVPVLSNAEGLEGLGYREGVDCLHAETDEEFIERSVAALADPARRSEVGLSGRELIVREHGPGPAIDRLLAAYEALR